MKKELPGIFKKDVDNSHSNNKKIYYTSEQKKDDRNSLSTKDVTIMDSSDSQLFSVEDKIRQLFKSSRYIFNIHVLIKTRKKEYDTKIAGKVKNSLVTVDGEIIPIVDIDDIIIKDRL